MAVKNTNSNSKQQSMGKKMDARGGAQPTVKNQPKVLRIGIIQEGKIVEERIIRRRESVFVGPSEKNDFVLPQEDVHTPRLCLFETKGAPGAYYLNFQKEMGGKFSLDGQVVDLADAISSGKAVRKGKSFQLKLTDTARGKVMLGNTTVLFQFVTPPPIQPKPQLPAAVKGSLFQGVELVISLTLVLSFMFHGGMILYFQLNEWPEKSLEEKYRDLQALLNAESASFEEKTETTDELDDGEGDEEFDEVEEEETPSKSEEKADAGASQEEDAGPQKSAEEIARERAEQRAALAEQMAQQGINKILGALSDDGTGVIQDVLGGGDVAADQDDLLKQVSGVGVASGDASKLTGPAGGSKGGEAVDVSQVKAAGGDKAVKTGGPGPEKSISGRMKRQKPQASGGTGMLNPSDVAKVVGRRLGAIKGCYETALKRNPNLKGKITIRFTIAGSGSVTTARPTLNELNDAVGTCISSAFKRFRFPPPEGGSVTIEYPFLFAPAN